MYKNINFTNHLLELLRHLALGQQLGNLQFSKSTASGKPFWSSDLRFDES